MRFVLCVGVPKTAGRKLRGSISKFRNTQKIVNLEKIVVKDKTENLNITKRFSKQDMKRINLMRDFNIVRGTKNFRKTIKSKICFLSSYKF